MLKRPTVYDIKVTYKPSRFRFGLELSETGDIKLVTGRAQLARQVVRAVVNEATRHSMLKATSDAEIQAIVAGNLLSFQDSQIDFIRANVTDLVGYQIGIVADDGTFERIDNGVVKLGFVHRDLKNGITYNYGTRYVFRDGSVGSSYASRFDATPSRLTQNQTAVIASRAVAFQEDRKIDIRVLANRVFDEDAVLSSIDEVRITRSTTDPRQVSILVRVTTLDGASTSMGPVALPLV